MNIVRRLLSSTGGSIDGAAGGSSGGDGDEEDGNHQSSSKLAGKIPNSKTTEQELLGLSHLKKLHVEYVNSALPANEKEDRLYAMLPLFCNVFSSVGPKVITERFSDEIVPFTQTTSRILVTEVRRRASNQSTEAAAAAIATFMEVDTSGGGNGWHLLSALNLLIGEGETQAEVRNVWLSRLLHNTTSIIISTRFRS
jgi:hypothetical protein